MTGPGLLVSKTSAVMGKEFVVVALNAEPSRWFWILAARLVGVKVVGSGPPKSVSVDGGVTVAAVSFVVSATRKSPARGVVPQRGYAGDGEGAAYRMLVWPPVAFWNDGKGQTAHAVKDSTVSGYVSIEDDEQRLTLAEVRSNTTVLEVLTSTLA
jgi:hypothetical protein